MAIRKVGVLGAGLMGSGIAEVCAKAGYDTVVREVSDELVKKGLEYLAAGGKAVWLVDADAERVMVLLPPDRVRLLGKDETLEGGEALPGFSCAVADFFE